MTKKIPKSVWIVNFSGLLSNISTSIVFGLSSSFMRTVLGINVAEIGLLQGIVDSFSYIVKFSSGFISDFIRKRRHLIILGIVLITLSKPMMALAGSVLVAFSARMLDRLGNGIQCTPRDALLGDLCPEKLRGRCYGLRNSLVTVGSLLGAFFSIHLMKWTGNNYQLIFFMSMIPCFIALLFCIFFVNDPINAESPSGAFSEKLKLIFNDIKKFNKNFWKLIAIVFVFFLSRYSDATFIINTTERVGLGHCYATTVMLCYNFFTCIISYPLGIIADYFGKERLLLVGFLIAACAHFLTAKALSIFSAFLGTAFWGLQYGIVNSMMFALVANYASINLRGTAFSIFYFTGFLATLIASFIFAMSCSYFTLCGPFYIGSGISIVSALMIIVLFKRQIFSSNSSVSVLHK